MFSGSSGLQQTVGFPFKQTLRCTCDVLKMQLRKCKPEGVENSAHTFGLLVAYQICCAIFCSQAQAKESGGYNKSAGVEAIGVL